MALTRGKEQAQVFTDDREELLKADQPARRSVSATEHRRAETDLRDVCQRRFAGVQPSQSEPQPTVSALKEDMDHDR